MTAIGAIGLLMLQAEQQWQQEQAQRTQQLVQGGLMHWLTASRYDHSARPDRILGEMATRVFAESLQESLQQFPMLDMAAALLGSAGGGGGPQPGIDRQLHPARYHRPEDMTETAYLYRATGGNLSPKQQAWMNAEWGLNNPRGGGNVAPFLGIAGDILSLAEAFSGRSARTPGIAAGGNANAGAWAAKLDSISGSVSATDLKNFYVSGGNVFKQMDQSGSGLPSMGDILSGNVLFQGSAAGTNINAATYAQAGLGAIGIWDQGAQGGALTGALGGALSGFEIGNSIVPGVGGLWGAVGGGVLGLLGGLFGHHSQPQPQLDQQLNPSLFNAPANFNEAAFMYRATGGNLTSQQQAWYKGNFPGFQTNAPLVSSAQLANAAKAPVVHVYIDGAEVAQTSAVHQVLSNEMDSAYLASNLNYRVPS